MTGEGGEARTVSGSEEAEHRQPPGLLRTFCSGVLAKSVGQEACHIAQGAGTGTRERGKILERRERTEPGWCLSFFCPTPAQGHQLAMSKGLQGVVDVGAAAG